MRTTFMAVLAAVLLGAGLAAPTAAAHAAAADLANLELGDEQGYNAVGPDREWNRNAEWVDVRNTSTTGAVTVKGLIVEDAWRHGQPASYTGLCNRYTVNTIPTATGSSEELPAGHTLRVYVGSGEPKVFGDGKMHAVYMNSPTSCGYNGHIFSNGPRKGDRFAAWDTAWIKQGSAEKSRSYQFPYGFTAPTR